MPKNPNIKKVLVIGSGPIFSFPLLSRGRIVIALARTLSPTHI